MIYLLVAPEYWGDMTEEQALQWDSERRIFPCGLCSTGEGKVYHNLMGEHRHVPANELIPFLPTEEERQAMRQKGLN